MISLCHCASREEQVWVRWLFMSNNLDDSPFEKTPGLGKSFPAEFFFFFFFFLPFLGPLPGHMEVPRPGV